MEHEEILQAEKVVGTKQTMKMVEKHLCRRVLVAADAAPEVLVSLLDLCRKNGVEVQTVASMALLGELCGIKIAAASAGIL